jgi:hypothetical protein
MPLPPFGSSGKSSASVIVLILNLHTGKRSPGQSPLPSRAVSDTPKSVPLGCLHRVVAVANVRRNESALPVPLAIVSSLHARKRRLTKAAQRLGVYTHLSTSLPACFEVLLIPSSAHLPSIFIDKKSEVADPLR